MILLMTECSRLNRMTGDVLSQAAKILKRLWGYDRFRVTQE